MSGHLRTRSPWAHTDADTRAAIVAMLPDGTNLDVLVTSDRRRWVLTLTVDGERQPSVKVSRNITLQVACAWLVARNCGVGGCATTSPRLALPA